RERRKRGESRHRKNDIRSRLGRQPHQDCERLRGASYDLHGLRRNTLHFGDRIPQTVGAGGTPVNQFLVQEPPSRSVVTESKNVVCGPARSGARRKIKFDAVLVLVEPCIKKEGLESQASTSKRKIGPVNDSFRHLADEKKGGP